DPLLVDEPTVLQVGEVIQDVGHLVGADAFVSLEVDGLTLITVHPMRRRMQVRLRARPLPDACRDVENDENDDRIEEQESDRAVDALERGERHELRPLPSLDPGSATLLKTRELGARPR